MVYKGNPVRPRAEFLISFLRSGSVDDPDLSYSMEMKSCRVRRAVSVRDGAVKDPVNELHVDHVVLTDHKERTREGAVVGCDRSSQIFQSQS